MISIRILFCHLFLIRLNMHISSKTNRIHPSNHMTMHHPIGTYTSSDAETDSSSDAETDTQTDAQADT